MTCQERQDQLLLLAFDQLDANEEQALREHIAGGCPVCAGALAEAQSLAAMLPLSLNPQKPDAHLKETLMARVRDARNDPMKMRQPTAQAAKSNWFMPAAIAAAVAIVVTGIAAYVGPVRHLQAKNVALNTQLGETKTKADEAEGKAKSAQADADTARAEAKSSNTRAADAIAQISAIKDQFAVANERATTAASQLAAAKNDLEKTRTDLTAAHEQSTTAQTKLASVEQQLRDMDSQLTTLQDRVRKAEVNLDFIRSPGLQLVTLQGKAQPAASANILYDTVTNRWLLIANGMQAAGEGKTYELWIITDKAIAAGTFDIDAKGQGTLLVNVPPGVHITQAGITDEPAGGTQAPTGKMQLAGNVAHS